MTACIGEPISWLRLESFALGAPDPAIAPHVAACPICRRCLDQIRDDAVALPPLEAPGALRRALGRPWRAPALAATAAIAVAVIAVIVLRGPTPARPATLGAVAVKGVGEITLELVRERAGEIRFDASRYVRGDRWKVVVTCPPRASAWVEVSVSDGATIDHPLAPAQVLCGNRVVVPGAFAITGIGATRVCASVASAPGAAAATACATLLPE